jgi:hypothetical protein
MALSRFATETRSPFMARDSAVALAASTSRCRWFAWTDAWTKRTGSGSFIHFVASASTVRIASYITSVRSRATSGITRVVTRIGCRGFTAERFLCGTCARSARRFRPAPRRFPPHVRYSNLPCRRMKTPYDMPL